MQELKPIGDTLLIKLASEFKHVVVPDKKYNTTTSGIVTDVSEAHKEEYGYLVGKRVFYEEYKDGTRTELNGDKYAFIKIEDVRGFING